jgi:uncharacterized membrane protein
MSRLDGFDSLHAKETFHSASVTSPADASPSVRGTSDASRGRKGHHMAHVIRRDIDPSLSDIESWTAVGGATALLLLGLSRRNRQGLWLAALATPLMYRGVTGEWPEFLTRYLPSDDPRDALSNDRGMHVLESAQVLKPIGEVYAFWRQLENLPRFMAHLDRVTQYDDSGLSHWVARGPGGLRVEWDAQIINEVENQVIGWESLPGSDVVTAGSVNMRLEPPAGRAGELVAAIFGRRPAQDVREDLRRLKQLLEAGELPKVVQPSEVMA